MSVVGLQSESSVEPLADAPVNSSGTSSVSRLWLTLRARDPIVCRDHRPLSESSRRRSLNWISPSMMAGGVRNLVAVLNGLNLSDKAVLAWLKEHVCVVGPFPLIGANAISGELYLPTPSDYVRNGNVAYPLRPDEAGRSNTDLSTGLLPLSIESKKLFKPSERPAFWSEADIARWLRSTSWDGRGQIDGRRSPLHDIRSHVTQDTSRGAAIDGQLFSTAGLQLRSLPDTRDKNLKDVRNRLYSNKDGLYLRVAVEISGHDHVARATQLRNFEGWHPLGGEGRVIHWSAQEAGSFDMPTDIHSQISQISKLRMMLVTPALFENGWIPDGIDDTTLTGNIPNTDIQVKLVSAAVERWRPVSGWSLEARTHKPMRRAVPEGAVYFFERISGDVEQLKSMWMTSVCKVPQDVADGYGVAVWGVW